MSLKNLREEGGGFRTGNTYSYVKFKNKIKLKKKEKRKKIEKLYTVLLNVLLIV